MMNVRREDVLEFLKEEKEKALSILANATEPDQDKVLLLLGRVQALSHVLRKFESKFPLP